MPIGELFLGAFLQVLFDRIASQAVLDFFQRDGLDKSRLSYLETVLFMLEPVIDNAEEKQFTNGRVKEWLHRLKAAVFDAEDLLDQIAAQSLASSMEPEPESQSWGAVVHKLISSPFNSFEKEAASKLDEIIQMLENMASQIPVLGLTAGAPLSTASQKRLTTSLVKESQVYGRKEEKDRIIKLLLPQETDCDSTVGGVAIVGMGGMGKTTLARSVYNDDRLKGCFDLKLWIYVSSDFDVVRLTKLALESISSQPCNLQSLEKIQVELSERLRGRKFLVVLDDAWSERIEDWELLCCPFNTGAQGSRIIVTTRNEGVADIMGGFPKVRLHKLSNEDGWSLLSRYALQSGSSTGADSQLVKIGEKIVEKCDGLPLAIKILGSLLRSKLERKHWEKVLSCSILDLPGGNDDILPALSLSYCFLPSRLKRCFAYCAMFPKGFEFEKEELVLLWMAGGFLDSPNNSIVIEEIGDECFMELLSRSFFDEATKLYGGQCYVIHDLIHDLAQFMSRDFCAHLEKNKPWKIAERACHISYDRDDYDDFDRFVAFSKVKRVRSFLPLGSSFRQYYLSDRVPREILPKLGALRVLSLAWYKIIELPTVIGDLKQLRYLDVSSTHIIVLPESICTLYNLQTLLLTGCERLQKLPTAIGNLKQLRHLDVSNTKIEELPESICTLCNLQKLLLSWCDGVQKLPNDMWKLSSLRCLAMDRSNVDEMPVQLNMLEKLHSLDMFVVGKAGGSHLAELRGLQRLRGRLLIKGLENVANVDHAREADLNEMGDLDDLAFEFDLSKTNNSEKERDVLENLRPHADLEKLTISYYGATSFPSWLGDHSFQSMTSLCLVGCAFCDFLPPLGQLPSLKVLRVERMTKVRLVGAEFYGCGSPFRCLEEAVFQFMWGWEEWIVEGVYFPRLAKLQLLCCPKLRGCLPAHLPSLERLEIVNCQQLEGPFPQLESIRELHLGGCDKVELREIFQLTTLTRLHLEMLPQLINMPPSGLTELPSLKSLNISKCSNFISFEDLMLPEGLEQLVISNCPAVKSLPEDMFKHTHILSLDIWACGSLEFCCCHNDGLPSSIQSLNVTMVKKMEFPKLISLERMQLYSSLSYLEIGNDVGLVSFPLGVLPKLQTLSFCWCENLENIYIPKGRGITTQNGLKSLYKLYISDCPKLEHVAREGLPAPNLKKLSFVGCENLKSLPLGMCTNLTSLRELSVRRCPALEPISDREFPRGIIMLEIENFEQLTSHWTEDDKRNYLHRLQNLRVLKIQGWSSMECFPEKDSLPTTLQLLEIWDFPNLKRLDAEGLLNLKSLQKLRISNCPQLKFTLDQDFPSNITNLEVEHFEHPASLWAN